MRLLLDSNVLLWAVIDDPSLSRASASYIVDPDNEVFVSAISLAEFHIKNRIHKLELPENLEAHIGGEGYRWLPFQARHAHWLSELPLHHRDPFDRMIIAQAIEEGMSILTSDDKFERYPVHVIRN